MWFLGFTDNGQEHTNLLQPEEAEDEEQKKQGGQKGHPLDLSFFLGRT